MRIKEIQEKIDSYKDEGSYQPLKIEFRVRPPLYVGSPWIQFDGVIQYLCLRDVLGEIFYDLPTFHLFDFDKMQLPIKRMEDVYHASVGIYNRPALKTSKIYKRFEEYYLQFHPELKRRKYNISSGYYKNHMLTLPIIITDKVTFYTCANKKRLEELLPHLTHLGMKTSIGGGKIRKYKVTEESTDQSFYKDGYGATRPIPSHLIPRQLIDEGAVFMNMAYKPPYWDKRNVTMCLAPRNQFEEAMGNIVEGEK